MYDNFFEVNHFDDHFSNLRTSLTVAVVMLVGLLMVPAGSTKNKRKKGVGGIGGVALHRVMCHTYKLNTKNAWPEGVEK